MSHSKRWVFRPSILPTIVTALLAPGLAWLGFWQLGKADYKERLLEGYVQAAAATAQRVPPGGIDVAEDRYRHLALSGTFDAAQQVVLDQMQLDGQSGFQVLTPLRLDDSDSVVMVNRGWVGTTGQREPAGDLTVGGEPRRITGLVDRFPQPGLTFANPASGDGWPRVMLYPKAQDISAALGYAVLPWQLLLDADQPDGFAREWRPVTKLGPERHLGYAVQWFALCATLLIIFVAVNVKREDG